MGMATRYHHSGAVIIKNRRGKMIASLPEGM